MKRLLGLVAFLIFSGKALSYDFNQSYWVPSSEPPDKAIESVNKDTIPDTRINKQDELLEFQTITSGDIEARHSSSLPEILATLGFQIISSGGKGSQTSLIYKGYSGFNIKVYIDGILANNTNTGEFDWNSIDITQIESISIVEVPFSGSAEFAGCIIYIQTKKTKFSAIYVDSSVSSYEKSIFDTIVTKFGVSDKLDKLAWNISGNFSHAKNEYSRDISSPVNVNNFDRLFNAHAGLEYFGTSVNTRVNLRVSNNNIKAYGTGASLGSGIEDDTMVSCDVINIFDVGSWKFKTTSEFRYDQMDYSLNRSIDRYERTKAIVSDVGLEATGPVTLNLIYRNRNLLLTDKQRHEIGFSASWNKAWDKFKFGIGCNTLLYGNSEFDFQAMPYLTAGYDFMTLSLYRAFVLPTFNQLYWGDSGHAKGNPNLSPEKGYAATLRFNKPGFPLWGNLTASFYEDKIRWTYTQWRLTPDNVSDAWLVSAQAGLDLQVPFCKWTKEHLRFQGDITFTRTWVSGSDIQIMWVPIWKAHCGVACNISKFSMIADLTYMGERYYSNINYLSYPAYLMLDATVAYELFNGVNFYLKTQNILDVRVVYHDGYFIPSRQITVGVRVSR
ncbi:TonB-dependent receptor plug domain-containing protein [Treponema sp.]|uniref:TonB-dependent receptor plug domain-containing protein n=1 Tax=Treponema sp. TaxID=166 RepID=UPI00298D9418|nr:TonB-dependent receptor plug domain-containing protein [Treponema sp.]